MYAGAAIGLVAVIVSTFVAKSAFGSVASTSSSPAVSKVASTMSAATIVGGIIVAIVIAGLWLWMAWKNGQGRGWARITSTVFFGLATLDVIKGLTSVSSSNALALILLILEWAAGLAAVIFMYQSASGQYYAAVKAGQYGEMAAPAYPPTPGYPPQQPPAPSFGQPGQPGYPPQQPPGQQPPPPGPYGQPPANGPY